MLGVDDCIISSVDFLMPISYKCFSIISSIGLKQKIGFDVNEVISIQIQHGEVSIFIGKTKGKKKKW